MNKKISIIGLAALSIICLGASAATEKFELQNNYHHELKVFGHAGNSGTFRFKAYPNPSRSHAPKIKKHHSGKAEFDKNSGVSSWDNAFSVASKNAICTFEYSTLDGYKTLHVKNENILNCQVSQVSNDKFNITIN